MYWVINGCCNSVRLFRQMIAQSCRNHKVSHELQSHRVGILEFGSSPYRPIMPVIETITMSEFQIDSTWYTKHCLHHAFLFELLFLYRDLSVKKCSHAQWLMTEGKQGKHSMRTQHCRTLYSPPYSYWIPIGFLYSLWIPCGFHSFLCVPRNPSWVLVHS